MLVKTKRYDNNSFIWIKYHYEIIGANAFISKKIYNDICDAIKKLKLSKDTKHKEQYGIFKKTYNHYVTIFPWVEYNKLRNTYYKREKTDWTTVTHNDVIDIVSELFNVEPH